MVFAATARTATARRAVWHALRAHPDLAVVDRPVAPRARTGTSAPRSSSVYTGFYLEDKRFRPVAVVVRDPQTGRQLRLTVIGVLSDTAPSEMAGIWTSQQTLAGASGTRPARPCTCSRCAAASTRTPGREEARVGVPRERHAGRSRAARCSRTRSAARVHVRPSDQAFMGLGLIVGVAALGVISARSVVERRQQIGVLRAIGFRRRMVQLASCSSRPSSRSPRSSSAPPRARGRYNVIVDSRRQPSWWNLAFDVPWLTLGVIFVLSTSSPWRPRWRRRGAPRACIRPKRCATSSTTSRSSCAFETRRAAAAVELTRRTRRALR